MIVERRYLTAALLLHVVLFALLFASAFFHRKLQAPPAIEAVLVAQDPREARAEQIRKQQEQERQRQLEEQKQQQELEKQQEQDAVLRGERLESARGRRHTSHGMSMARWGHLGTAFVRVRSGARRASLLPGG